MGTEQSEVASPELGSASNPSLLGQLQKSFTYQHLPGSFRADSLKREALSENGGRTDLSQTLGKSRLLEMSLARRPNWDGSSEGSRSGSYKGRVGAFRPQQLILSDADGNFAPPDMEMPTSRIPRPSKASSGSVQDRSPHMGHMDGADGSTFAPVCMDVAKLLGGKPLHDMTSAPPANDVLVPLEGRLRSTMFQEHSQNKVGRDMRVLQPIAGKNELPQCISDDVQIPGGSRCSSLEHPEDIPVEVRYYEEKEFTRKTKSSTPVDYNSRSGSLNEVVGSHEVSLSFHGSDDKENAGDAIYFSEVSQKRYIAKDSHETSIIKCTPEVLIGPEHSGTKFDTKSYAHRMQCEGIMEDYNSSLPVCREVIEWASYNGWRIVLVGIACILLLFSSVPPTALREFFQLQKKTQKFERINLDLMCDPLLPIMHVCMSSPVDYSDDEYDGLCKTMPEMVFGLQKCPSLSGRANFKDVQSKGVLQKFYAKLTLVDLHKNISIALILLGIGFSVCIIIAWCLM